MGNTIPGANPGFGEALKQALALHQSGNLPAAEQAYRDVLNAQPAHFDALSLLGVVLAQRGDHKAALHAMNRALKIDPKSAAVLYNRGQALAALNRLEDALASYGKAVSMRPDYAMAYNSQGNTLLRLGRTRAALVSYDKAVAIDRNFAGAHSNRATVLHSLKRYDEALAAFDRALTLMPDYAEGWNGRGVLLCDMVRYQDAVVSFDNAIRLDPRLVKAVNDRGNALFELGRYEEALAGYDKALAMDPRSANALCNRGNVMQRLGRFEDALADYGQALALDSNYPMAWNNRGVALQELGRYAEALADHEKAIALERNFPMAHNNRGNALAKLRRYDEAVKSYGAAIAIAPDYAEALNNWGNALLSLTRYREALVCFDKAVAIKPDYADAFNNRGNGFLGMGRHEEALANYDIAVRLDPGNSKMLYNRGSLLGRVNRIDEAIRDLKRVLEIDPAMTYVPGEVAHYEMMVCDWAGLPALWSKIAAEIDAGKHVCSPFVALSLPLTPAQQLKCTQLYMADKMPAAPPLWRGERYVHDRIRVAYVSADFHAHATAYLMAELFELHDRTRFEFYAVSLKGSDGSATRQRLEASFEHFIDASLGTDQEIARILRDLEIDIAIDLKGITENSRPEIFAHRPAPLQVSYLGYPGTMAADFIDYIIADPVVITPASRPFFTEAVATLPDSYQVNDFKRAISGRVPTRAEAGLPDAGIVFCCFNNTYKITPEMFGLWMELLLEVKGSVLWLFAANAEAPKNLRREAEACGVSPDRLVFADNVPLGDHLARLRLADLVLDTLPYNAHTTASDALWAGVPLLTCSGEGFPARVAESLLRAVGLPELVTRSPADYRETALRLARDPAALSALRAKLASNRETYPLFDTARFTRHLEAAYVTMFERYRRGEPPADFTVEPVASA